MGRGDEGKDRQVTAGARMRQAINHLSGPFLYCLSYLIILYLFLFYFVWLFIFLAFCIIYESWKLSRYNVKEAEVRRDPT